MTKDPDLFFDAMLEKMERRAKVNDGGMTPWDDYTRGFLDGRLEGEIHEYRQSKDVDELLDIANFCMFIWLKVNGGADNVYDIVFGTCPYCPDVKTITLRPTRDGKYVCDNCGHDEGRPAGLKVSADE